MTTAYNSHDSLSAIRDRSRVQITFPDQGRTRLDQQDECDINQIIAKFQKTGAFDHANNHEDNYGFASDLTFQDAMQTVATANSMFADLPSSLRNKFHHDPAEFLSFVQNDDNTAEMAELGLLSETATREYLLKQKADKAAAEALEAIPPSAPVVDNDEAISPTNPGT